jgi:Uncharacterized conserved protein (DUF2304)
MQARIQLVAILGAAILLLAVLELVRRRRLMERYALLWLLSAVVLLALAIWSGALAEISHAIGVVYPPNALFFIAIGFIILLLLGGLAPGPSERDARPTSCSARRAPATPGATARRSRFRDC